MEIRGARTFMSIQFNMFKSPSTLLNQNSRTPNMLLTFGQTQRALCAVENRTMPTSLFGSMNLHAIYANYVYFNVGAGGVITGLYLRYV